MAAVTAVAAPVARVSAATPIPEACGSPDFGTWAEAVSDQGVSIGISCARTRKGRFVVLAPPAGSSAFVEAVAISRASRIVGLAGTSPSLPAVWATPTAVPQTLPLPPGTDDDTAEGIDDLGDVLVDAFTLQTRVSSTWILAGRLI